MRDVMIVFRILIVCLRLAGEKVSALLCFLVFWIVIVYCRFHLRDDIKCMPRYVYGSIWVRVEFFLDLYMIFCDWMNALKVFGLSLELLGHLVMTHFDRLRSMCDHSTNLYTLSICG